MSRFARNLTPPYYAVTFSNRMGPDTDGYDPMAAAMAEAAAAMPGYLGMESVRDETGFAITISYWTDEDAIAGWRAHAKHAVAQKRGKDTWYEHYELRVAKVERAYSGPEGR